MKEKTNIYEKYRKYILDRKIDHDKFNPGDLIEKDFDGENLYVSFELNYFDQGKLFRCEATLVLDKENYITDVKDVNAWEVLDEDAASSSVRKKRDVTFVYRELFYALRPATITFRD